MPLTKEQFSEFRKQGLTVDQIINFEKKEKPQQQIEQPIKRQEGATGLHGVAVGAGKGIFSTLTGASSLGERFLRGTTKALLPKSLESKFGVEGEMEKTSAERIIPEELRTAKGGAEKLGFGAEQMAEFFIPGTSALKAERAIVRGVSEAGKLRKLAGFGARIATEASIVGGQAAIQEGKVGTEAKTGAVIGAIFPVLGQSFRLAKSGVPKLMRFASNIDDKAFEILVERSAQVNKSIKGGVTPLKTLNEAKTATKTLRKNLSLEWEDGVGAIKEEMKRKRIDFPKPITNLLNIVNNEFRTFELPRNMKNVEVGKALNIYNDINKLYSKRLVRESASGINVRKLQKRYRDFLVNNFRGKGGAVDNLLTSYSTKLKTFNQIDDIINAYSDKPTKVTTALNKLQQIFEENKTAYLDAILELEKETGVDILSKVAAQKFSPILPSGVLKATGGLSTKKGMIDKLIDMLLIPITSPRGQKILTELGQKTPKTGIGARIFGKVGDVK